MIFTREDILKIQNALLQLGRKDSEFKDANTPLNSDDEIAILQDGINKKVSINNLLSSLGLLKKDDFINVSDRYDEYYIQLSEAITIIAKNKRKKGLVITFQDIQGNWKIFQFDGELNNFINTDCWKDLFDFKYPIIDTILPDEEDLTLTYPDINNNSFIKFKDKDYDPNNFSGKGYKILRKNIVDGKNVLTQEMINESNTIYEIRYDFDLNNKYIKLPLNSDLFINGGSIKNGVVVCNNSRISDFKAISDIRGICLDYNTGKETTIYGDIINRNVILAGTVNICWNNLDKFGLSRNLLFLQKIGINDIVIAFKTKILNSEFVLGDQDDKKINNLNSYINGGARVKMLKFHQPENEEDKWIKNPTEEQKSLALEYAVKFKNYVLKNVKEFSKYIDFEYVGISNEANYWETNTEFATILSDLAKEVTALGYKPICSRNNIATMPTVLAEQLYMYGYNNYGSLSYRDDKSEYNKYMYLGFNNISNSQLSSVKNQLIFITECGVLPYDKSLRAGSYYTKSLLGNKNFKIPIIYYKSMKDYIKNNPVYCVTDWWFENYTTFDINNNNLHKELYNILLNL